MLLFFIDNHSSVLAGFMLSVSLLHIRNMPVDTLMPRHSLLEILRGLRPLSKPGANLSLADSTQRYSQSKAYPRGLNYREAYSHNFPDRFSPSKESVSTNHTGRYYQRHCQGIPDTDQESFFQRTLVD